MGRAKKTLFLVIAFLLVCTSAYGKEASSGSDEWRFELTPYFWAAGMDVVSTVSGMESAIDMSFGDVLETFDVFGLSGRFEVWKGKWVFILDALYLDLSTEETLEPPLPINLNVDIDVDITYFDLDLAIGYRVWEPALMKGRKTPSLFFDVMAGGRYVYLKQEIELEATVRVTRPILRRRLGNTLTRGTTLGGSHDWVEPFVAARIGMHITDWLTFMVRGDIGGFGIGSASDLTWNVLAGFDVKPFKNVSFKLGYRYMNIDYDYGSGADEFGIDGSMYGPWLGMTIHF